VRRFLWPLLASVVLVTFLLVGVMPTRTYLQQRGQLAAAEERVDVLSEQNEVLEERIDQLLTDEEIERLAREQYNLVKPGEEAYAILPPADAVPTTTVPAATADGEHEAARPWWRRAIDFVVPG
jgi:cell division protein FtsB